MKLAEKYAEKYKTLLHEEQTKDLVSLLLDGYEMSEAIGTIAKASLFNCCVDVAS